MGMTLKDFLSIKTTVVSEFGMCDLRPLVICNDGFHISIQASQYHNCDPEVANAETYESVEVSCEEDELLDEYDNFDDWLSHRSDCLEWIERFSPAALLRKCPAEKAPKFFYSCVELPPKGELPKDPTHAAMFCIKFEALCKEKGVPCKVCGQGEFLDFLLRR